MTPEVIGQIRLFWLIFAGLGLFCLVGMLLYNRFFSKDTDIAKKRAWKIMLGVYIVLSVAGIYFVAEALFLSDQIQWKTLVQELIILLLGSGGVLISLKKETH